MLRKNFSYGVAAVVSLLLFLSGYGVARADDVAPETQLHWYRCNTHTHTRGEDVIGGSPEAVAAWYRSHGYQCLVVTDHEFLTDVASINRKYSKDSSFLVLQGQEITQAVADSSHPTGFRYGHVNGINIDKAIMPVGYPQIGRVPLAEAYKQNIWAIRAARGIPQINHPNLQWSVRLEDLLPIPQPFLLEIWNAYPEANNMGGVDEAGNKLLSTEELWDGLLSHGKIAWGVASDDAHDYRSFDSREAPTPGKAWIVVQAASLTVAAVTDAMRNGHFYASTGISLETYSADAKRIAIKIKPMQDWSQGQRSSTRYQTRFVGANGQLLAIIAGLSPTYTFKGDESYVRAAITDSDGRRAWTQPVFRDGRDATK